MVLTKLISKIIGSRNDRVLHRMQKEVERINVLEPSLQKLTDAELRAKTDEFRKRLKAGESLQDLLPEAFATVRETSRRVLKMRHFDVQLIGGMVLHEGKIAEMRTGEGKTLVATLPAYLNALSGEGVHIITVNDYLAKRDAQWMEPVYTFLGLTTGVILSNMNPDDRRRAYGADITYGTNNEFGFDYLRDNMAFELAERVQRILHFAIVDEVDSILIDEARTPLIISGPTEGSSELYLLMNRLVPQLKKQEKEGTPGDYTLDEKARQAYLTEEGHQRIEQLLVEEGTLQPGESLYNASNISMVHHLYAALRAHALFHRDVDYIVANRQVVIVDEHTGRTMPGRRWSDGLHQAVEAKEGVPIQQENQTLASITFQNYFRLYQKLSGMTGTADTEAYEFQQIYGLEVIVIPTNQPVVRQDHPDKIYLTAREKFNAVIADIKECLTRQQPVLVGTASIETSEYLSGLLSKENIAHQVLNAKYHEKEAQIIIEAGRPGTVTIATNMAGRGTDIVLGGKLEAEIAGIENPTSSQVEQLTQAWQQRHQQVVAAGGLHVIGSERHESRRIDNQLRGRSGRQGDPGSSRFYLSLEDNLMRIFAGDWVGGLMQRMGMQEGEAIEHTMVSRAIESAQRKVEGRNFDIRKQLLEFDDVANEQRKVVYTLRTDLLSATDISNMIRDIREEVIEALIAPYMPADSIEEQWDIEGLEKRLQQDYQLSLPVKKWLEQDTEMHQEAVRARVKEALEKVAEDKQHQMTADLYRKLEKSLMLQVLDAHWREHLAAMDHLRQGIHLRGYAQKNPKQEYKRESFELFAGLLDTIKREVIRLLATVQLRAVDDVEQQRREVAAQPLQYQHDEMETFNKIEAGQDSADAVSGNGDHGKISPFTREIPKVGRNELCPCGSQKKYKHCHGQF